MVNDVQNITSKDRTTITAMEQLQQDIATLRQQIIELKGEKNDLELRLELNTQHSDFVADELFERIEETMRESIKRFRSITEATPVPIIISRLEDDQILYANHAATILIKVSDQEILNHKTADFYQSSADHKQILEHLSRQGHITDYELLLRQGNDSSIWVSLIAQPLTFDNQACVLNAFYDLTERRKTEVERARLAAIEQELDLAQEIQERLLPSSQPNWPELDIICYSASARNVGGDFYAYHQFTKPPSSHREPNSESRFAIAVGDVAGKGMPAALLMSLSFASLQAIIKQDIQPGKLLAQLDQTISEYTKTTNQNCALCYAEISKFSEAEGRRMTMRIANAGCMEPIIRRANGSVEWVNVIGLPLGTELTQTTIYQETALSLNVGDIVILSSDGIVEAMTPNFEMFGFERFEQAVATGPATSAEAMLAHIRGEIGRFTQNAEIQDDLTIVVIRF